MIMQQKRYWNLDIYLKTLFYFMFNWSVYPLISRTKSGPQPKSLLTCSVATVTAQWGHLDVQKNTLPVKTLKSDKNQLGKVVLVCVTSECVLQAVTAEGGWQGQQSTVYRTGGTLLWTQCCIAACPCSNSGQEQLEWHCTLEVCQCKVHESQMWFIFFPANHNFFNWTNLLQQNWSNYNI